MDKQRKKRLEEAIDLIDQVKEILDEVKSEEEDAYDNLPESSRAKGYGEEMEERIDILEDSISLLEDASILIGEI